MCESSLHRLEKSIKHLQHPAASLHNSFPALNKWRLNISPAPRWYGPWHWHRARCLQQSRSCWGQPRYPEEVIWDSETWWNIQLSLADLLYNWRDWNCLVTGSLQNITPPSKYFWREEYRIITYFQICPDALSPPLPRLLIARSQRYGQWSDLRDRWRGWQPSLHRGVCLNSLTLQLRAMGGCICDKGWENLRKTFGFFGENKTWQVFTRFYKCDPKKVWTWGSLKEEYDGRVDTCLV